MSFPLCQHARVPSRNGVSCDESCLHEAQGFCRNHVKAHFSNGVLETGVFSACSRGGDCLPASLRVLRVCTQAAGVSLLARSDGLGWLSVLPWKVDVAVPNQELQFLEVGFGRPHVRVLRTLARRCKWGFRFGDDYDWGCQARSAVAFFVWTREIGCKQATWRVQTDDPQQMWPWGCTQERRHGQP